MLENIDKAILGKILEKNAIKSKFLIFDTMAAFFVTQNLIFPYFSQLENYFLKLCEILKCFTELILSPKVY